MRIINGTQPKVQFSYLEQLEQRLRHGDELIRQLEMNQQPVDKHIEHWLNLLKEYEQAFDDVREAA